MFIVNNIELQSSEILLNQVSKLKMELYHKHCMSCFRTVSIFDSVIFFFYFSDMTVVFIGAYLLLN